MKVVNTCKLPKVVRAFVMGTFLATAAVGITACGEEENTVTDEVEEAGDEIEEGANEVTD